MVGDGAQQNEAFLAGSRLEAPNRDEEKVLFAAWLAGSRYARKTQKTYVERVGVFLDWLRSFAEQFPRALYTPEGRDEAVAAFRSYLEPAFAPSTVNVTLAAVDCYFDWRGLGPAAAPAVRRVREAGPTLTRVQRSRALDVAAQRSPRDRALFVLALQTGLREAELAGLEMEAIGWRANERFVRAPGPRGGDRVIPVDRGTLDVLLQWRSQRRGMLGEDERRAVFLSKSLKRLSTRRIDEIIRSIGEEAGVADLSPGVLRNTFKQDLVLDGRTDSDIAYLMGVTRAELTQAQRARIRAVGPPVAHSNTSAGYRPQSRGADEQPAEEGGAEQLQLSLGL